jgi:hypothetical protein
VQQQHWILLALFFLFVITSVRDSHGQQPTSIALFPASCVLTTPRSFQRLLVEAQNGGQFIGDWTKRARFTSSRPRVAKVSQDGTVTPVANGQAIITARVGSQKAQATVTVKRSFSSWSFRNHVLPVMTKAGCNSGACHGALAGKGGLKLTLRGYDPVADYDTLTRQVWGRRVNKLEPTQSLILLKPTMDIPHGGGRRFETNSLEYSVIAQWISSGTPPLTDSDPTIQRLEVFPPQVSLKVSDAQQILVRAHFSDGHAEDVTRWVKFGTSDSSVATVDDDGRVTVVGSGEAAMTIWYLSKVAFATVTVAYPNVPMAAQGRQ